MALPPSSSSDPSPETLSWLKTLPVAPEYHPSPSEFQDPISYILKIEKEASRFGICKIIPPLPPPPKKSTISNLTRSLSLRNPNPNPNPNPKSPPTFTTRQQQIGFCPRKPRPVQKPVWQSGGAYTVEQFEAKAKQFEKNYLRRSSGRKAYSPLEIETLFWKACADKPFSVEYANDMPGSAFDELGGAAATNVGDSKWNMRGVSRAKGSLLEFMKEEIPGVTSPMVYIAMLFSWFAWHVEDHDLHSLNYLHMGAGKTWYGVPKDAALAFEEVVRVHGYGGEVNPLVTFAILGEKTTVMSPEVLVSAGIPCCRLVQNAGEFVVTFPRAYHSGFSHGFNCGEAANIATPAWLRVAKEAAIRRASINYPPMVSHFQLLYALALSLCSRIPPSIGTEPRSSRLKHKKRGEGEMIVKESFVQSVVQNNDLLHILLEKGSYCVLLPRDSSDVSLFSNSGIGTQIKIKPRLSLGLCSPEEALEASGSLLSNGIMVDRSTQLRHLNGFCSIKGNPVSVCQGKKFPNVKYSQYGNVGSYTSNSDWQNMDGEKERAFHGHGFLDQGQLSCVTCGILSFACMAIIQPNEAAARHLMASDCSFFDDWNVGSDVTGDIYNVVDRNANNFDLDHFSAFTGRMGKNYQDGLDDILAAHSSDHHDQVAPQGVELVSDTVAQKGISSLDLLAVAYGDSSDSEKEDENDLKVHSFTCNQDWQSRSGHVIPCEDTELPTIGSGHEDVAAEIPSHPSSRLVSAQISSCASASDNACGLPSANLKDMPEQIMECSLESAVVNSVSVEPNGIEGTYRNPEVALQNKITSIGVPQYGELVCKDLDGSCHTYTGSAEVHQSDVKVEDSELHSEDSFKLSDLTSNGSPTGHVETTQLSSKDTPAKNTNLSFMQRPDKDSCRMHVFCLEHAIEVEKQLRPIGGVHMLLLCHPDYPKVEGQAKSLEKEFGINHLWKDIQFRDATEEDREKIRSAMADEESIPNNRDWAVKLRINLYYSVELSKAPLYSKQMPYNSIIYKAFGRSSSGNSPTKPNDPAKRLGRQKKIVLAGKWCGKVWMSNQVHPYLAHRDSHELEPPGNVFCTQGTDEKDEVELRPTTVARKYERKRRNLIEKKVLPTKKLKSSPQWEESTSQGGEDLPENSTPQYRRILRSGLIKHSSPPLHGFGNLNQCNSNSNLRDETEGGPSTRLRRRPPNPKEVKVKPAEKTPIRNKKAKKPKKAPANNAVMVKDEEQEYQCDMDGCTMGFNTKQDLLLHKRNICPIKGCGKKFFSHKYIVQHRRVHLDDRPLKCPWKGCKMSFKWAWARTEHIRVHTGARPYICREAGCGQTFRFVSDFSRHKRKTGHSAKKGRG